MSLTRTLVRVPPRRSWLGAASRCLPLWHQWVRHGSTVSRREEHEPTSSESAKKTRGSYTRVLAVLAASGVAGYALRSWQDGEKKEGNIAQPGDFVKYALVRKENVSSTCSIFTLRPAGATVVDTEALLDKKSLTSLQFKQPQIQVARNYTLLPPVEGQESLDLRFLIRKERHGEVSSHIHRLDLGSEIEIRGPSVEYVMPEDVESIIFLAGGTGIAPALQIAAKRDEQMRMDILWASRRREDCRGGVSDSGPDTNARGWNLFGWWRSTSSDNDLTARCPRSGTNAIVAQLDETKSSKSSLKVEYYVDEEGTLISSRDVDQRVRAMPAARNGDRLILISGPEGFINYWAGPKQWAGGREVQGPLGGVLGAMDLMDWKVVKL
ncbi:Oxidoreductase FAD-binding domain [Teratosphaeria destructans]|uniref:Oxidoreductase FAD-binding domain n=1 Tax=Teratosphaeria destructans TaxID=418781 RepID=A0A9W7SZ34_9PEZI|nr:Oxidoreductase FAD-binding domain [Teratosphaeria destructans]